MDAKVCITCGAPLKLEEFGDDELCWNCFEKQFNAMIENTEDPQDKAMLVNLLNILKENHGVKK